MSSALAPTLALESFVNGDWVNGEGEQAVQDKFSNETVTLAGTLERDAVNAAVAAAAQSAAKIRLTQHERCAILSRASALVLKRAEELATAVRIDTGFAWADVNNEVKRTAETLQLSAEEARRLAGEVIPLDGAAGQSGRLAYTRLDPVGLVCAITPFNSPLNTVAHKVGPALAAGNGVVLKPASQTPRSADALLRILLDAGLPPELITVLYGGGGSLGQWLAEAPGIDYFAFTGSTRVGELLHRNIGLRRSQLEMGSLSSTIICADADLEKASAKAVAGAFRKSGQVCTSVQRLYVQEDVLDDVATMMASEVSCLQFGDPAQRNTDVGPLISSQDAVRVESWIDQAVALGGEVVVGGCRTGNVVAPTVLSKVSGESTIMTQEVFGPVVLLESFRDLSAAITNANATPYGLAAGIFTRDISRALDAADQLNMGSVHINETSSSRVDLMPFSGIKRSGFGGPEGPRYATRDMSQERLITISRA